MAMTHDQARRAGRKGGSASWARLSLQERARRMQRMRAAKKPRDPAGRLLAKVEKLEGGCWLFSGALSGDGYGSIGYAGAVWKAHRLAWRLWRGQIPAGMVICHKCDVRNCVNPRHLFIGSQHDNVADMISKGRFQASRGASNGRAKLTARQASAIRRSKEPAAVVAARYGVRTSHVYRIRRNLSWRTA